MIPFDFTLSNDRTHKIGMMTTKKYQEVKIGDYISTGKLDADSMLPIFFQVAKIEPWGNHPVVFVSEDNEYHLVPTNYENRFVIIPANKIKDYPIAFG